MNKFVYFMAVGLAFTVLQVATVSAADVSCAKLADGSLPPHCQTDSNAADHESAGTGHAAGDHGGMAPATTGDDAHTGGAQDCANLKEADGSAASPDAVAACHARQSSHANSAHAGMAPGTTATGMAPGTVRMCGDVPCATDGGGDALGGQGGEDCAILANADLVRECVARRTAGGN